MLEHILKPLDPFTQLDRDALTTLALALWEEVPVRSAVREPSIILGVVWAAAAFVR